MSTHLDTLERLKTAIINSAWTIHQIRSLSEAEICEFLSLSNEEASRVQPYLPGLKHCLLNWAERRNDISVWSTIKSKMTADEQQWMKNVDKIWLSERAGE